MKARHYLMATLVFMASVSASSAQPSTVAQREAMKKLDFLIGQWKGEGWLELVPNQRRTFKGVEIVQFKLDGLVLTFDGMHRGQAGPRGEEGVVHHAFAFVNYDDRAKRFRFQGFTARGNHEDGEATITDGQLVRSLKVPQFGDVRYTIKRDDKGRWVEIGEVSHDGKETRRYFEMTLERVIAK